MPGAFGLPSSLQLFLCQEQDLFLPEWATASPKTHRSYGWSQSGRVGAGLERKAEALPSLQRHS